MSDYSAREEMAIRREERELERRKARAEASKDNFTKNFAKALKDDSLKQRLAKESLDVVKSGDIPDIYKKSEGGINRGYRDEEVITGTEDSIKRLLGERYETDEWES